MTRGSACRMGQWYSYWCSHRPIDRRLVAPSQLGVCLLEDGKPQHRGGGTPRKAWGARGIARQSVVDEDNLPLIARACALNEEADHVEAVAVAVGRLRGWQRGDSAAEARL